MKQPLRHPRLGADHDEVEKLGLSQLLYMYESHVYR